MPEPKTNAEFLLKTEFLRDEVVGYQLRIKIINNKETSNKISLEGRERGMDGCISILVANKEKNIDNQPKTKIYNKLNKLEPSSQASKMR